MTHEYGGLSSEQARTYTKQFGLNEIPKEKKSVYKMLSQWIFSPISLMLVTAAALSFATNKVFDGYFILFLLLINIAISIWQEHKADNAIKKLNEHLTSEVKILRDTTWKMIDSRYVVKDDVIELAIGDIVPADGEIIDGNNISVNESALTGESLPKEKKIHDVLYSGSFIATGLVIYKVTSIGKNTYFGKTLFSVEKTKKRSLLEKDILQISEFLSLLSILGVIILSIVFLLQKASLSELLTLDLSLLIAGIPISLPTIMTLIIALGVLNLAKKHVIVRRLSSLEDLSNVNLLLTDKTGTLTKNKITVQKYVVYDHFTETDLFSYALISTLQDASPIAAALQEKAHSLEISDDGYTVKDYIPADSIRKHSTTTFESNTNVYTVLVGAPQVILQKSHQTEEELRDCENEVKTLAMRGYRSLAVAVKEPAQESSTKLVGLIALSDDIREEAPATIQFLKDNSIEIAMVTGDNKAIAQEISEKLSIPGKDVLSKQDLETIGWNSLKTDIFKSTRAFAEILPDDKYKLVHLAKQQYVVATTGDGINDLPALKEAHVGIAVQNAVSALKASADIVLLANGITVIRDAIIEGRNIFTRIYSYSVYRISESLRLILTIVILGLVYRIYPLTPLQLILIALLNDIPIISLAFDRVHTTHRPAKIHVKERFVISSLYGLVGVANSIILFFIMKQLMHLDWNIIQTVYFLKITVSGHLLIYVAHTRKRWFRFLPSREVIMATTITQLVATGLAIGGIFMPAKIPLGYALFVWIWSFMWMQISEGMKYVINRNTLQ